MIRIDGRNSDRRRTYDSEGTSGSPLISIITLSAFTIIYLWLALSQALFSAGDFGTSFSLYPWDSVCEEQQMYYSSSEEEMGEHIEHILSMDPYNTGALRMQAFRASSYGDYDIMTESIERYLSIRKYDMEAHSDMIMLLYETAERIEKDDPQNAGMLRDYILQIQILIEKTKNATSPLAYKLRDKPDFTLSEEANDVVEKIKVK